MKKNICFFVILIITSLLLEGCCSSCRFRRTHSLALESTTWRLCRIAGENIQPFEESFVIVMENGNIHGTALCNKIIGTYTLEGSAILFSNVASTKMLCPNDDGLEARFLEKLSQVTHYDVDYRNLMFLSKGAITMVFEAVNK